MELHPDFNELLKLFADFEVEYAVVGAYALAFHGVPRYTGDLDVVLSTDPGNAERVMDALRAFGFGDTNLEASDFTEEGRLVRLGHPPVRIDLLTSISGVTWDEIRANRAESRCGDVPVWFIGRGELIRNKRASGRTKDLADLEALGER